MADMSGKKANVRSNEKDETVSVGSLNCSEEGSNTCQRKTKSTTKKSAAKSKNSEMAKDISQIPNIPRSINLYNKTPKTAASSLKRVRNCSCIRRRTVLYKKTTLTPCRKQKSPARKHGSQSPFSIDNKNLKHPYIKHNRSSASCQKTAEGDSISPSHALANVFSLVSLQAPSFEEYYNINHQKNYSDYMKQLNVVNRNSSVSPWGNSLCYSEPDAIPLFPKLSTSKTFLLKRRTYSCGILSVNDSGESSFCDEKNGIKDELDDSLKQDSDYSENSDVFEDSESCDVENSEPVENTSILKVQEPLRVKYIDETTMLTKELIIYSNEFLERIYEKKGRTLPKRDIFDSIIKQSIDYKGEKLRVIRDTEEFLSNLKNASKSQLRTKLSKITKYYSPQKMNKNATKPPRRIQSAPSWIRWWGNTEDKVGMNKWKIPDFKIHSSTTNDTLFTKNKKRQSTDNTNCSHSFTKDGEQSEHGTKSRTSLKRVNCELIISSRFRLYFQFYSKLGGRLKSGAVISRMNSHFWLKRCGVIFDDATFKIANDCFTAVAKSKIVLNISDYMQYLTAIARTRRIFIMDIIRMLMSISIHYTPSIHNELEESRQLMRPMLLQGKINKIDESQTQHN